MLWFLAGWLALSIVATVLFSLMRLRRGRPQSLPRELQQFLRQLAEELGNHAARVQLNGMVPGQLTAVLAVRGQEVPVPLHHLFRRCLAFPDKFAESVARFVDEVEREGIEAPSDHAFADAALHILPQVRSRAWLAERGGRFGDGALVHRPLGADLAICYVIDEPSCMTFVCQAHLRQWQRQEEDLYHLATSNLHRLAGAEVPLPERDGEPVLLRTGDGFDAARVLLLDPERVEGLLVGIPDRDVLWLGSEARQDLSALMARNEAQSQRAAHPVSPHLYRVRGGQLVPLVPLSVPVSAPSTSG